MKKSVVHPLSRPTRSINYGILAKKATPRASSAGTRTELKTVFLKSKSDCHSLPKTLFLEETIDEEEEMEELLMRTLMK